MMSDPRSDNKGPMQERHLLPVGVTEFHEWADRIISGSMLPATPESLKYALSVMICELPVSCNAETDAYFIQRLRKSAANQVAIYYREKIFPEVKARLAQEQNKGEATPPQGGDVVEIKRV